MIVSAKSETEVPSGCLQIGQWLSFFLQSLQTRWPFSHWGIGNISGTWRHTGHSKCSFKSSKQISLDFFWDILNNNQLSFLTKIIIFLVSRQTANRIKLLLVLIIKFCSHQKLILNLINYVMQMLQLWISLMTNNGK